MKKYVQSFSSVAAFAAHLDKAETTEEWGRTSSLIYRPDYNKTPDFPTSQHLMLTGDEESAKLIQKCGDIKINSLGYMPKQTITRDVAGFRPNVGAFLAGKPKSMYRRTRVNIPKPVVTIYYCANLPWYVSPTQATEASANLLSAILQIEANKGVKINLYSAWACYKTSNFDSPRNELIGVAVKIKDSNQPFNLMRVAYPIIHPDFTRRQCWRYLETCGVKNTPGFSYGLCANATQSRKIFDSYKFDKLLTYFEIRDKTPNQIAELLS